MWKPCIFLPLSLLPSTPFKHSNTMRPLTEEETKTLFTKLSHYIGSNIVHLVDRPDDAHVFRLHRDRVYYASEVSSSSAP